MTILNDLRKPTITQQDLLQMEIGAHALPLSNYLKILLDM